VTRQSRQPRVRQLLPALLSGVVAFALVLMATDPPGPGLDPDALSYMGAAESVAAHGEYRIPKSDWTSADSTEPLAHFPPAYPTVLALPVRLGMAPPQAARLVQAAAAFVTITTLVLLVGLATSPVAGVLLAAALLAMTSMHEVHVSVLSEPLYLACTALVLAAMVSRPDRPLRAGIPAAVGVMTRYAGASLVGAAVLWQLAREGTWLERVRRAALAAAPALLLQGIWVIRTRVLAGSDEIRKFALYGNLRPTLVQGGETLAAWLIPDPGFDRDAIPHRAMLALAAGCSLAVLGGIGVWRAWRSARAAQPRVGQFVGASALHSDDDRALRTWRLLAASAVLLVCYLGIVLVSRLIADPEIPLDERILSPALLLLMTIVATGLARWWRDTRLVVARVVVGVALLWWWLAAAAATYADARYALDWGSDFAGEPWRRSALLEWARTSGAASTLYTNWPGVVYFSLHRPAHELPMERDAKTLAAFADTVRAHRGRVLVFDVQTSEFAPMDSLLKARGLTVMARLQDGLVLGADR
jgi:phosphate starvation-inducible membrane PsiE